MSHVFEDPIERLAAEMKSEAPRMASEQLATLIGARSLRERKFRNALVTSASVGGFAIFIGIGVLPQRAVASLATVIQSTKDEKVFFSRIHTTNSDKDDVNDTEVLCWQFAERQVSRVSWRAARLKLEPNAPITKYPAVADTQWFNKEGRYVDFNPNYGPALEAEEGGPMEFYRGNTLSDLGKIGKLEETARSVKAHGGVYDRYIQDFTQPDGTTRTIIYAEPDTHRIRFVDIPYRSFAAYKFGLDPQTGMITRELTKDRRWSGQEIEYRYPGLEALTRDAPKEPAREVDEQELKSKFLSEITVPVATQTVGGVKKTLYGVVFKGPGDIFAITDGAPRNGDDKVHGVEVLGAPTRPYHNKPRDLASISEVKDGAGFRHRILTAMPILGKEYDVETASHQLVGAPPKRVTLKVPVWRYDRKHPVTVHYNGEKRTTYPSIFVGYVTFTTDKIYLMQQGIGNGGSGAALPSYYPDEAPSSNPNPSVKL